MKTAEQNMEQRILDAAASLFIEQGFARTTTGQIAELAGCNQALVHYYYRTKDKLFEKVFEEKKDMLVSNLLAIDDTGADWEKRMANIVGAHFDFYRENPGLVPFIFRELLSNPDRIDSLLDKLKQNTSAVFERLEAELNREVEKGTIRPITLTDLMFTIVSLNIAPFLAMPVLKNRLNLSDEEVPALLDTRRQETIDTVLARLRK